MAHDPSPTADRSLTRDMNRARILGELRSGARTRAELQERTGLTRRTVAAIVRQLLDTSEVVERKGPASEVGRPPQLLHINAAASTVVGVNVGPHWIRVTLADGLGRELSRHTEARTQNSVEGVVKEISRTIGMATDMAGLELTRIAHTVVTLPANVDRESQLATSKVFGWVDANLHGPLAQVLGSPVSIHDGVHAAAVAEVVQGAAVGSKCAIIVEVDHRTAAAIVRDGAIFWGASGRAGEIGLCAAPGNAGVETSAEVFVRQAQAVVADGDATPARLSGDPLDDIVDMVDLVAEGDPAMVEALNRTAESVLHPVSWLINVFNPDRVVLTGSSSVFPKELVQGWFDLIAQLTNPQAAADVTFSASTFGHSVWTRGAVLIALERLRPNPHPVVQALIPRVAG